MRKFAPRLFGFCLALVAISVFVKWNPFSATSISADQDAISASVPPNSSQASDLQNINDAHVGKPARVNVLAPSATTAVMPMLSRQATSHTGTDN